MKAFLFIFFMSCNAAVFSQANVVVEWTTKTNLPETETIYYKPDAKLKWENFEGVPLDTGIVAAITFSGFGYQAEMKTVDGKSILKIKVFCYFNKKKSWVKPGKKTDEILQHEQLHFDISYLAACTFFEKLTKTDFPNGNIKAVLPDLYNESVKSMDKMQDEYDSQTQNGRNKASQAAWIKQLNEWLEYYLPS
ncbi:MAG: DUF922 domain-containing protein [Sphingobacteriales bacterium]|nr:DUF922 domain-containing protein [Sphingobacteriales bacterium]